MKGVKRGNSKGQAWSIDLIIGLLMFVIIIITFYVLLSDNEESKADDYTDKADVIAQKLFEEGIVDSNGEFNEDKFLELASEDYEGLKERLGITGEFCLFIESNDEVPEIQFVLNSSGQGYNGIGNPNLNISNFQCNTQWS